MIVLVGALALLILAAPAMSETSADYSGEIQSPVVNGGAYSNYQTIFVHGTNAETELPDPDVSQVTDIGWGHVTKLYSTGEFSTRNCFIHTPIPSYEKSTGGIQPAVRYLALVYSTDSYSTGTLGVGIKGIDVYNGFTKVKPITYTIKQKTGGTYQILIVDLGKYYTFDRGLSMAVYIDSDYSSQTTTFTLAGYGARFEW